VLRVPVDETYYQGLAADGVCRMVYDARESGSNISINEWSAIVAARSSRQP